MEERLSGDRHISVRPRGSPGSRWVRRGADKAGRADAGFLRLHPSRWGQVAAARPASASCEWERERASPGRPPPAASRGTARSSAGTAGPGVRQQQTGILAAKKMLLYRGAPAGPGTPGGGLARAGSVPQAFRIRLSTVGPGAPEGTDSRERARVPGLRGARGEGWASWGLTRDGTFSRPQMSPRYLQSNSSSHTRPFSAIAELLGEWRGRAGWRVASPRQRCQRGAVDARGMHEARGAGPLGTGWGSSATVIS